MIKHLLHHELFSQKAYVYILTILWLVLITNFFTSGTPTRHVLLLIVLACWIPGNAPYYEQPALLNSLPVTRKKIITAKYLSPLVWFIPATALVMGYVFLFVHFAPFPARLMTGWDVLLALAGLYLLMSFFNVLYIAMGYMPALILSMMAALAVGIGFQMVVNIYHNPRIDSLDNMVETIMAHSNAFILLLAAVSLIITLLSYTLSVRLYERKDF